MIQPIWQIKKKHYDTREFLQKITLLYGQLCHKPYGFLVFYSIHVYSNLPKIGRQCTPFQNENVGFWVKVTCWFWLMYTPRKLKLD